MLQASTPPERDSWERLERSEIRALQFQRLQGLLEYVSTTNAFYSRVWHERGIDVTTIKSLEDFADRVPTVEKGDFITDQVTEPPYGSRLRHVINRRDPLMLFTTSGTSGQGQELHGQTLRELQGSSAVYAYMYRWARLRPGDTALLTLPLTMLGGGRLEYHGALDYGLNVLPAGNYDAERKLELIERFKPKGLIGTTSYFWHLAALRDQSADVSTVEALFCGGEGASLRWYDRLERDWNARVFDRYGSTQSRNDHMFTCEEGTGDEHRPGMLHNVDPHVLVEVIDPATGKHVRDGEKGEIVITSLYHLDTPVIRCRMKDLAVYRTGSYCRCGRPFCGIEIGSISRLDEMYRIKGINVWPQAIEQVVLGFQEVDEYEIVLSTTEDGLDRAELRFMPKSALAPGRSAELCEQIAGDIRRKIALRFQVTALAPETLARSQYKAKRWKDQRDYISDAAREAR
ncbi:phenylacetate--CoA ligase family protein [Aminobacter carboxidus]|jgi:phenylacetate-CoA ligase|uniref:AMP-binding protein n=1 Tax=Aminobacter carboxidus TaxID=376165 RepID=A0ABR9GR71_9HYPH|nr:AMP-binding protein [Aminobacter carboxidus]MBE1206059.1 AMP-binding protein [Aminobacter carboxidus]